MGVSMMGSLRPCSSGMDRRWLGPHCVDTDEAPFNQDMVAFRQRLIEARWLDGLIRRTIEIASQSRGVWITKPCIFRIG